MFSIYYYYGQVQKKILYSSRVDDFHQVEKWFHYSERYLAAFSLKYKKKYNQQEFFFSSENIFKVF